MKPKEKPTQDEPLKVPLKFDDAMKRALKVKPPAEGWPEYERRLKRERSRQRKKTKR